MRIEPMQSTNNISQRAHFICDNKGNFEYLWDRLQLEITRDNLTEDIFEKFSSMHKGHILEIKNITEHFACVFNQKTGKTARFNNFKSYTGLLNRIMYDFSLYNENTQMSRIYKCLTGQ